MRCLQIAQKALSISDCSFYAPNEGPDTSVWMLILGGIRCAALRPSVWPPGSCGLVARRVPAGGVGDLRSHLLPPPAAFVPRASQTARYYWGRKYPMAN